MNAVDTKADILIVGDDAGLAQRLGAHGLVAALAPDLDAARVQAEAGGYAVVATPLDGQDAHLVAERLRRDHPLAGIVLLTDAAGPSPAEGVFLAGADSVEAALGAVHHALAFHERAVDATPYADCLVVAPEGSPYGAAAERLDLVVRHEHEFERALAALHEQRFECIVLADTGPTELRDFERLLAASGSAAVIAVTDAQVGADATALVQLGMQDVLPATGVEPEALERALRHALQRKRNERRLVDLAHTDQLTGLRNRVAFREQLALAVARARRSGDHFAVLYLDLDDFKEVNDSFGHDLGDELLLIVAERIRTLVREVDTVARLGGDEFAVLLEAPVNEEQVTEIARRVLEGVSGPAMVGERALTVTTSIGGAMWPSGGDSESELMRNADSAMYAAKRRSKNAFQLSAGRKDPTGTHRTRMEQALRRALDQKEYVLFYQPKLSLKSNAVVGLEALIRWKREGELVPPIQFIPILEETYLIREVGAWVIQTAAERLSEWQRRGLPQMTMAVNLSAKQFDHDEELLSHIAQALKTTGIPPDSLELEITESLLMRDAERAKRTLTAIKDMGVRLAIDDFGTGYSSLAYLHRFPVDTLKIDKSFVQEVVPGKAHSIVTAIIRLGHELGLEIVAEGVETEAQMAFLRYGGCDVAQGFLIGRPAP